MTSLTLGYPDFESELAMAKEIDEQERIDRVEAVSLCDSTQNSP